MLICHGSPLLLAVRYSASGSGFRPSKRGLGVLGMEMAFTAVFQKVPEGYIAFV
jgi:hypothetical protein